MDDLTVLDFSIRPTLGRGVLDTNRLSIEDIGFSLETLFGTYFICERGEVDTF